MTDRPDTVDADIRQPPAPIALEGRRLTAAEFLGLAAVPPRVRMVREHQEPRHPADLQKCHPRFHAFHRHYPAGGIPSRNAHHVIAWRDNLERRKIGAKKRQPAGCTIRNRLAALSSLFEYLCDRNAVPDNPVKGVKRPKTQSGVGATPTIGRSPGPSASRGAHEGNRQGEARSRDLIDAALPCAAARRALQTQGRRFSARATRRTASQDRWQGREDALRTDPSRHQRTDPRLSRGCRPRRRRGRRAVPACQKQHHKDTLSGNHAQRRLQTGNDVCTGAWL